MFTDGGYELFLFDKLMFDEDLLKTSPFLLLNISGQCGRFEEKKYS